MQQTVLDGHAAWLMHNMDGTTSTFLSWQHGDTAERLGGQNITDADLKQVARSLVASSLAAWDLIDRSDVPGPMVSPGSTVPLPAGCDHHDLQIMPAG